MSSRGRHEQPPFISLERMAAFRRGYRIPLATLLEAMRLLGPSIPPEDVGLDECRPFVEVRDMWRTFRLQIEDDPKRYPPTWLRAFYRTPEWRTYDRLRAWISQNAKVAKERKSLYDKQRYKALTVEQKAARVAKRRAARAAALGLAPRAGGR
ncbi:MAG: hypothetical protein HYZ29_08705 [Myxococcales bacterium]|nr:hypothetical protein [Myxococcales bacterium]